MSTITIDDVAYAEDALSDEAKTELGSMQVCDQRIATLQTDLAISQTARNAYANALKDLLPKAAAPKAKAKAKAKKD
ncbi:DUF6447 family protein [Candidatus Njordibacter sp. Uisw_058]|jgi:hypothetical protein|uniref:DUF6447 family protein n=1 Tax=Candidatus Njordibacter sp. Uisw_058 TaxID=3230974 RepID=UPI003D547A67